MGGGSAEEIAVMLDEHYNGLINIADYWVVGDTRTESITAIPSGTTGEAQSAQSVDLVILGMNHDDKADGNGKAAVTVQAKDSLKTKGYMNSTLSGSSYSLWSTSQRRTWCNGDFKSALPDWLQELIKPVTKISNRYGYTGYESYRGQTTTTDDVFLLSEFETFGTQQLDESTYGVLSSDGTQYEYMKIESNRIKNVGSSAYMWWLRSSFTTGNSGFISCHHTSGAGGTLGCNSTTGIAPAFCL
jgi:hypothetical protein